MPIQHDHQDVVNTIHEFCRAFDQRDWTALRRCLAPNVFVDYSSFRGTLPTRMAADAFVALRQTALEGLVTQHLSVNHLVAFTDRGARCRFDFVIHRWPQDAADSRFFHTFGYYEIVLRLDEDAPYRWIIESIAQQALRSEGSPEPHGALRKNNDHKA
ncbi:MAG: hypothetical protein DME48_05235 [Verrucomicrobia bacterium]|nr:MAG: hypothetical protein DME48_05235 [Verrucomicrobiota bacterium]